ncbi:TrmH family RNA methyltransferase [Arthrobacter sp. UM1]|uniref:TrmH family RNA methyltransferase n=1 Tax=Arthrobacter sp. UM1 TaxID=2766776 RepID=UPI001CF6D547|nr:RNA methyltransferase [Arthrobacter sp. UM1]MCB4208122.1 RNA methyltransferase [Arthrobacter sp. UM1]
MEPLSNPRSDRVKAVARLRLRSHRAKERRFLAEGPQAVREALRRDAERAAGAHAAAGSAVGSPARDAAQGEAVQAGGPETVLELYATGPALERHGDIAELARSAGSRVRIAEPEVIAAMADTESPQGMVAVCRMLDVPLAELLAAEPRLVAVLARIQDPGNAGTVLRAADSAGAGGAVVLPGTVDPYNPKVVRSTAGSLFHVPFALAGPDALEEMRASGLCLLAADGYGESDLDDLLDAAAPGGSICSGTAPGGLTGSSGEEPLLRRRTAWLFGNEAQGLSEEEETTADARVRVPIYGRAESLNVGTAATVCLYASARAQRG